MRRTAILLVIFLLLTSATLSAAAGPDHPELTGGSAYLLTGDGTNPLQDDQDPPPDEGDSDSQQLAIALLSGISDLIDQIFGGQALDDPALTTSEEVTEIDETPVEAEQADGTPLEEPPLEEPAVEEGPASEAYPPLEEDPVQEEPAADEVSEARKRADELIALAEETYRRRAAEREGRPPEEGDIETAESSAPSLLQQAQQMIAQVTAEDSADTAVDEELLELQDWSGKPDCDAPPAPMVNWSRCDKSGIELIGVDLSDAILVETNFSGAYISDTDFTGAVMKSANFSAAELQNVIMRKSKLMSADFTDALIIFADLSFANANMSNFDGAELLVVRALHTNFVEALMTNTGFLYNDFTFANLVGADFSGARPRFNFFRGANMEKVNFSFVTTDVLDMTGARIQNINLSGANMTGVWLKYVKGQPAPGSADLQFQEYVCPDGTYFDPLITIDPKSLCDWNAHPSTPPAPPDTPDCDAPPAPGVNWSGCDLTALGETSGFDLRNANLQGTIFNNNRMYMWDLSGADLSGAQFTQAVFDLSAVYDTNFSNILFDNSDINFSDATYANFNQASMVAAEFSVSTMRKSNLSDAGIDSSFAYLSDFSFASLQDSRVENFFMDSLFMEGVNLIGTDLTSSIQEYVDMSGAQIDGAILSSTTFEDHIWLKDASGIPAPGENLSLLDGGTLICPAGDAIFGPLTLDPQSLCTWAACWEGIKNGGFFGGDYWSFPATEFTAELSDEQALSADYSARTGIVDPEDNTFSFSSVSQKVTLPAGSRRVVLSFYLYPQTNEPKNHLIPTSVEEAMSIEGASSAMGPKGSHIGDAQWVSILDSKGRELLRPLTMRSNSETWEQHEVDLSQLVHPQKDVTIEVYFGAFNNGHDGVTALYVDDVSLGSCSGNPLPDPPEPPAMVCSDVITNGGFEAQDSSWLLPITPYPASYSEEPINTGEWSMGTGIEDPEVNVLSFSSAIQRVHIPDDATAADLAFSLYPQSSEDYKMLIPESIETVLAPKAKSMKYGDAQWVIILDKHGQELQRLVSTRSNEQSWREYQFDLLPFKDQMILLYFGTFNNGLDGRTSMNVDDVTLNVCIPEVE